VTDDILILQAVVDLETYEGFVSWLYCDDRGFVTVGIGNLVRSPDDAVALPMHWKDTGKTATDEEKRAAWIAVNDAFRKTAGAVHYRRCSDLRITNAFALELVKQRLQSEFLPALRKLYHSFDTWPKSAKRAEIDMVYNLGVHGLSKFANHVAALQRGDFTTAAAECVRSEPGATAAICRKPRNKWAVRMFDQAAGEAGAQ